MKATKSYYGKLVISLNLVGRHHLNVHCGMQINGMPKCSEKLNSRRYQSQKKEHEKNLTVGCFWVFVGAVVLIEC